jgi:hypothetical protein
MSKRTRLVSAGLLAGSLTMILMANQWGHAAEPPAYPVPATAELMQLLRDEHDLVADMIKAQLAAERDRYAEQRTVVNAAPSAVKRASAPPQSERISASSLRGRRNS